jgi:hypothetical protein
MIEKFKKDPTMTRQEILKMYKINKQGRIISDGKFKGQMIYVPYFVEVYINDGDYYRTNGCGQTTNYLALDIEDEDRNEFPEIPKDKNFVKILMNYDEITQKYTLVYCKLFKELRQSYDWRMCGA